MSALSLHIKTPKPVSAYEIQVGQGLLDSVGQWTVSSLGQPSKRVAIISNKKVFDRYGPRVTASLKKDGFACPVFLMSDGERYKNLDSLQKVLKFFGENKLSRTDAVVALGGGVVGDLTGFAASVYLRGIQFFQIPTSLLAMIDSSVGGKTGINTGFGKNLIGSFYQPKGVLIDVETIQTLPRRELTAGFCEAVKQGILSGRKLLDHTDSVLRMLSLRNSSKCCFNYEVLDSLAELIFEQVSFKAKIVKNDQLEDVSRTDARSRKILNLGHTFGHALEKITNYRRFKHGEAVGWGLIFAAELSKTLELMDANEVKYLNDVVHRVGSIPPVAGISPEEVVSAFQYDKKLISNSIQWVLLRKIGEPLIISGKEVPTRAINQALSKVLAS